MTDVVIVSGARTAVGRFGGAFKNVQASDLGATVIKAAVERSGIDPGDVDEVILGNVLQAAETGYAARRAMIKAGLPETIPAMTINRACSSGLEAINFAVMAIMSGQAEVIVAGGTESMSTAPYLARGIRFDGPRMGDFEMTDSVTMGLACPIYDYHMGVTAENVAERYEVSRDAQDELAVSSHARAIAAQENGYFDEQIVPFEVPQRRGDPVSVTIDEHPRPGTTMEGLSGLRTVFKKDGTVTAGNSAGINDAAAAVVVMSAERAAADPFVPDTAAEPDRVIRSPVHALGGAQCDERVGGIDEVLVLATHLQSRGETALGVVARFGRADRHRRGADLVARVGQLVGREIPGSLGQDVVHRCGVARGHLRDRDRATVVGATGAIGIFDASVGADRASAHAVEAEHQTLVESGLNLGAVDLESDSAPDDFLDRGGALELDD